MEENSWSWLTQCGSICHSSSSSSAAPALEHPHNQIFHLHPPIQAKPTSSVQRLAPEAVNPWTSNFRSYSLGHTELDSSFLSLLSSPPHVSPNELPTCGSNASGCAAGSEISLLISGLLAQNLNSLNAETGVNLGLLVSPKSRVNECQGSSSTVNNVLQGAYPRLPKLQLPRAVIHQNLSRNENRMGLPSLNAGYVDGETLCNVWKTRTGNNAVVSQKIPLRTDSSVSCQSSNMLTGCPKVFCLGRSGDLLLSNTGLLGVLCSCHGLHMSISKFSEHSGLFCVNPGDAVQMDSGETISQWRKIYFLKLGIRTPEDHIGWDWPQGLSVTAGSSEHGLTLPSMSTNSDHCDQGCSPVASVQSMNPWSLLLHPKNSLTGKKAVAGFVHCEKQQSTKDCSSHFPKGRSSSSKNSLHFDARNQMMGYSKPGSSTITNLLGLRGPYNVLPAISSYKDAIYKSGDSVDVATGKSVGSLVDVDMISSNVELRLGQPSQQSQTLGSSVIPASGSHSVVTHSQLQESLFLDQHVHKTGRSRSVKGSGQHICLPGTMSTSSTRTEQNQFENVNYAFGVHTVPNASQSEHIKDNASRGSVTSELFANFRSPLQENNYCNSINDAINDSHAMVSKSHSESSPSKSGQFGFPSFRGEATETKLCANVLCSKKCKKVDKVGCNIDSLHSTAELNMGSHAKSKAEMWNFSGVAGDTDRMTRPVLHDKGPNMYQFTGMMTDEPDTRNSLNYFGQVSCPDHIGRDKSNVFRTVSSPMNFGTILSSQAVSVGISATNSIAMKSLSPSCNKDNIGVSPYILDENLKMTAFQPRLVLSNQKIASGTSKTFPDPEGSRNCCGQPQGLVCSLLSDSRKNGFDFTTVPNASEVTRHPVLSANSTLRDTEKLPSVTGADKWCNCQVAAVSQGQYCPGKDSEIQCYLNSDLQPTRQFFLRFHGNENSTLSNEVGNCQEFPYGCFQSKFSCSSDSNCFTGRCDLMGEPSRREFREREGNAVNLVEPFRGPKLDENCTYADKDNSFGQKRLMVQNIKKAECNSFQWRDVPRKVVKDTIEVSKKCLEKSSHHAQKEHEISNISSGCSAPAVTQVSIEANNKDSSTVDGVDSDNLVVDEGSAIERCWSSDDDSERRSEFYGITSKTNLVNKRSSKSSVSKSSHGLIEELRFRDTLKVRRMQNKTNTSFPVQAKGNLLRKYERDSSKEKRRRVKWKRLYSSVSASYLPAALSGVSQSAGDAGLHSKDVQMLPQGDQQTFTGCPCSLGQTLKQKRPAFSSFDALSRKRELHRIHHIEVEDTDSETNLNAKSDYLKASEAMGRKQLRSVGATEDLEKDDIHDSACVVSEINAKVIGVDCVRTSKPANACHRRRRPVVCGKYGIISNANSLKPAKIVSLRTILKAARRCRIAESQKVNSISLKESKKASSNGKKEMKNEAHSIVFSQLNSQHSVEEKETAYSLNSKDSYDLSHIMKKRRHDGNKSHAILESSQNTQLRRKYKEVRKRSIYELTITENNSSSVKSHAMGDGRSLQIIKSRFVSTFAKNAGDDRMSADGIRYDGKCTKEDECRTSQVLDVVCCVCGSSDKDKSNCLLECSRCLIKVHQACYGVCKVPKAQWFCRPCKANSKNTVCVLCGYGGGAMTQALRSRNLVKSLLKAWSIESESHLQNPRFSKSLERPFNMLSSTKSVCESDPFLIIRPAHIESPSVALWNTDLSEHVDTVDITCATPPALCNSITAGILDSTVKQWVHMVCGLWTPGTRCPNVDTMSSFDVSGAYRPKQDMDCSICQRPGGSCIQCRVADCDVQFHPWCAHQKGLLQSEVEGIDNESVGFYGRCMLHAIYRQFNSDGYRSSNANHGQRECTCARTEGYKGRKRDGFHHNLPHHSDGSGCLVPQEQLNAWIHINGQKMCTRGPLKLPTSVIEYDCRKEYARYKQSRGWKHLVVYKSGIHGLGLYTSQFISRGAMVVEYVGEIVGLHVADKRETEYQAGKKVQYKSACYFFRIDKEHIIDATRKGGIARFVNHSCLPNCVAKVISVRNEKKVVFFAERDIYPGEEVTYDYHFNHEDEVRSGQTNCELHGVRGRPGMPSKVEYQLVQVSHMAYLDHVIPSLN